MRIIFTICSNNYLAQAAVLRRSLAEHVPDAAFHVILVDRMRGDIDYAALGATVTEIERLPIPDFGWMIDNYGLVELNTAVKPFAFLHLLSQPGVTKVVYLDPDIRVFAPLDPVWKALEGSEVVLTPHTLSPVPLEPFGPLEAKFLLHGLYNLGFVAARHGDGAKQFLRWWAERLARFCLNEAREGVYVDQKWVDLAPILFPQAVGIIRHPGCNMAWWNLHERRLAETQRPILSDGSPLVFYHFSNFDPRTPGVLSSLFPSHSFETRPDLRPLYDAYACDLVAAGYERFSEIPCHFDHKQTATPAKGRDITSAVLNTLWNAARAVIPTSLKQQLKTRVSSSRPSGASRLEQSARAKNRPK